MSTQNDELRDKLSALFTDYVNIAAFAKGAQDIGTIDAVDRDLKETLSRAESYISTDYLKKSEVLEAINRVIKASNEIAKDAEFKHLNSNIEEAVAMLDELKQALGLDKEGK